MDDTDTSHLQSPDATLPASSLANDLKISLTYSKRAALCRVHKMANLKESVCVYFFFLGGGGPRDVWPYIENPFLYFRLRVSPTTRTGFHYALQEL